MEQLEQIDLNSVSVPECAKIEICVEIIDDEIEQIEQIKDIEKSVKSRLSRLIKKSSLNARYTEQLIPIEKLEHQRVYRNYGIY